MHRFGRLGRSAAFPLFCLMLVVLSLDDAHQLKQKNKVCVCEHGSVSDRLELCL